MISSVSGGIATELGGGKFANGARSAAFVSLFNRYGRIFFNPREAHNRATGNVDILGRNKQQQERERFLSRENYWKRYKFLSQFKRDPLNAYSRQLHNMIENLIDYRSLFPVKKLHCDKDYYKWKIQR